MPPWGSRGVKGMLWPQLASHTAAHSGPSFINMCMPTRVPSGLSTDNELCSHRSFANLRFYRRGSSMHAQPYQDSCARLTPCSHTSVMQPFDWLDRHSVNESAMRALLRSSPDNFQLYA